MADNIDRRDWLGGRGAVICCAAGMNYLSDDLLQFIGLQPSRTTFTRPRSRHEHDARIDQTRNDNDQRVAYSVLVATPDVVDDAFARASLARVGARTSREPLAFADRVHQIVLAH